MLKSNIIALRVSTWAQIKVWPDLCCKKLLLSLPRCAALALSTKRTPKNPLLFWKIVPRATDRKVHFFFLFFWGGVVCVGEKHSYSCGTPNQPQTGTRTSSWSDLIEGTNFAKETYPTGVKPKSFRKWLPKTKMAQRLFFCQLWDSVAQRVRCQCQIAHANLAKRSSLMLNGSKWLPKESNGRQMIVRSLHFV